MHDRYDNPIIIQLWSDEQLLAGWQNVEMMVMKARVELGEMPPEDYGDIEQILVRQIPDVVWWKGEDKQVHHDLNAFLNERLRYIPRHLQPWFHKEMTSYDTEESAFVRKLLDSLAVHQKGKVKFRWFASLRSVTKS